jgi:hypothetical protein
MNKIYSNLWTVFIVCLMASTLSSHAESVGATIVGVPTDVLQKEYESKTQERIVVVKKLEKSFEKKEANEAEYDRLDNEFELYDKTKGAFIDAWRPTACESTSGEGDCESFNRAVHEYNDHFDQYEAKREIVDRREERRNAEAQPLLKRHDELVARIKLLKTTLIGIGNSCMVICKAEASDESKSQCLSRCYDGATAPGPGVVDARPASSMISGRTPEQAIWDYRNSGGEELRTLRIKPPPAPP